MKRHEIYEQFCNKFQHIHCRSIRIRRICIIADLHYIICHHGGNFEISKIFGQNALRVIIIFIEWVDFIHKLNLDVLRDLYNLMKTTQKISFTYTMR